MPKNKKKGLPECIRRKEDAAKFDLNSAFSWYQHNENQIAIIRGWSVTVLFGYIGFLFVQDPIDNSLLLPLLFSPIPFFIFEIYRRIHLAFLRDEVKKGERILIIQDTDDYIEALEDYTYRDLRMGFKINWIKYFFSSFLDIEGTVWYILVYLISIFFYRLFHV